MSDVIIRDKAEYHARTGEQMERHLALPPWSLRQKIALTCRILAAEGHESALAGQITARGERPGTYWMLSFGLGFDEARASNLVLVDEHDTSKTCPNPNCTQRHKVAGRVYRCPVCGFQAHRDVVGAVNILRRQLLGEVGKIRLAPNELGPPIITRPPPVS